MADHGLSDHCFTGFKHAGEPTGTVEKIADVETYVARPPAGQAPRGVILFYADVFGPLYINNKLIEDYFAAHGFIVAGIDYFEGDPIHLHQDEKEWDRQAWATAKRTRAPQLVPAWNTAIREKFGRELKYFAVGYCFGAPFVLNAGAAEEIAAGAVAHPSRLEESQFQNLKAPIFISAAEIDQAFPLPLRRRAEDILVERKHTYHFQVFSGVTHGFAVRGNPEVENERWAKETSASGIIGWFTRFSA